MKKTQEFFQTPKFFQLHTGGEERGLCSFPRVSTSAGNHIQEKNARAREAGIICKAIDATEVEFNFKELQGHTNQGEGLAQILPSRTAPRDQRSVRGWPKRVFIFSPWKGAFKTWGGTSEASIGVSVDNARNTVEAKRVVLEGVPKNTRGDVLMAEI